MSTFIYLKKDPEFRLSPYQLQKRFFRLASNMFNFRRMKTRLQYRLSHKQLNWSISDSNRPPIDCEPIALPDELIPHNYIKIYSISAFMARGLRYLVFLYRSPYSTGQPIRDAACCARRSIASFSRFFTCSMSARSSPLFERRPH